MNKYNISHCYSIDEIIIELKNEKYSKLFFLVDENTSKYCLSFFNEITEYNVISIQSGEENKNIETCNYIWKNLLDNNADRNSLLINLGGGVICDIGGFVASTFKRGIQFINIPTTLLAMVDAAIGGKTGVNHQNIKNQIGTFYLPKKVIIYSDFIKTVDKSLVNGAFGEIIKYFLIDSKNSEIELLNYNVLQNNQMMNKCIQYSVNSKLHIIEKDFRENNLRKILNFGHTIGHSIETIFQGKLNHGYCVMLGMIAEMYIVMKMKLMTINNYNNYLKYCEYYLPSQVLNNSNLNAYELLKIAQNDKKNKDSTIIISTIIEKGNYILELEVSNNEFIDAIEYLNKMYV